LHQLVPCGKKGRLQAFLFGVVIKELYPIFSEKGGKKELLNFASKQQFPKLSINLQVFKAMYS